MLSSLSQLETLSRGYLACGEGFLQTGTTSSSTSSFFLLLLPLLLSVIVLCSPYIPHHLQLSLNLTVIPSFKPVSQPIEPFPSCFFHQTLILCSTNLSSRLSPFPFESFPLKPYSLFPTVHNSFYHSHRPAATILQNPYCFLQEITTITLLELVAPISFNSPEFF